MIKEILFSQFVDNLAKEYKNKPAITIGNTTITYEDIKLISDKIATFLIQKGIKKGEHVALWGYNSIEWFMSFLGITKIGAVAVLLNYSYTTDEAKDISAFSDVSYILYGNNRETKTDENAAYKLGKLLNLDKDKVFDIRKFDLDNITVDSELLQQRYNIQNCHDDSMLVFTSGSSSFPKAVRLSQYSVINSAIVHGKIFESNYDKRTCVALPLFHCFGLVILMDILSIGSHAFVVSQIKPEEVRNNIKTHKINGLISVPVIFIELAEDSAFDTEVAPYITFGIMGGGVTTPEQYINLSAKFKNAWLYNGYGATECSPYISYSHKDVTLAQKTDTVGMPMLETEVKIQDVNSKKFLPANKIGEVVIKGFHLMNGYYKLPASEQPIDSEGWYHTGDLGFLDNENFLTLCGRIKDIIIKNGENISPLEVEKALTKVPGISQAKCFGYTHKLCGEDIAACIIMKNGCTFDKEITVKELKAHIAPFKIPSQFFVYEQFPLKSNGKLDALALKEDMNKKLGM